MAALDLKIGTDPETFLKLGNKIISAHGIIPGTKSNPYKLEKGAVQLDGVACEFNIEPAKDSLEFNNNITVVLEQVKEIVKKVDKDIEIVFEPIARFEPKYWNTLPAEVKVLGCDPDFNFQGIPIEKDVEWISANPLRTAAGHIHIGFTENEDVKDPNHFADCCFLASHFSVYPQPRGGWHALSAAEQERLKYYGADGAFRPKPYGVELRQWSNVWVEKTQTRIEAFEFISRQVKALSKG